MNRRRFALVRLEDRLAPAVVSYATATGALTFTADAGEADVVSVSAPAANQIQIRVGGGDAIALGGDAVGIASFALSSSSAPNDTLTIATGPGQAPATTFVVNLGDQGDRLDFGLATTPNGVGSVAIDGQGGLIASHDTVTIIAPITVGTDLSIKSETINANAPIAAGGSVTLTSVDKLNPSSPVVAGGDVTVTADFGINLSASISASGNVSLRSNFVGDIAQSAGTIAANGLAASFGNYGNLTLDQAGNDVNVFAAYVGRGSMRFADIDDLMVGTVGSNSGITVPGLGVIATLATGGAITLTKDVVCESTVLRPAAGGVVQTGGVVKGNTLVLLGSGPFVVTQPGNDFAGIAANVTGPVTYADANELRVSTFVTSLPYDPARVSGITTAGNPVSLTAGGNLLIGGVVGVAPGGFPPGSNLIIDPAIIDVGPAGTVSLRSGGYVVGGVPPTQPNPHPGVVAKNLSVSAATGVGGVFWTQVARLEAQTAAKSVIVQNTGDLVIGGVDPNLSGIRVGSGTGQTILSCTGSLTLEEGVTSPVGPVSLSASGTVSQAPAGTILAAALSVRTTAGDIVLGDPNQVGILAAANTAAGGSILFVSAGDLTVGSVNYGAPQVDSGIKTNNGDVTIRTGGGFATRQPDSHAMFDVGTGRFLLMPGQRDPQTMSTPAPAHTIVFDVEIIAGSARLGVPAGEAYSNVFRDTFSVRPSANVVIDVEGNDPTSLPGDALSLIIPSTQGLTFIAGTNPASGTFIVPGRQPLKFAGIESPPQATLTAYAIQTGPQTSTDPQPFVIEGQGGFGPTTSNEPFIIVAPVDYPFIVPAPPLAQFTAPRLAVADVNGDALPDLIVAAGSNSAPLVTVVSGVSLFGPQTGQPLRPEDLLAQFLAYDPALIGGVYVAAGDFDGDGQAEIVTGAGEGGGPHVRTFRYDASAAALGVRMKPFAGAVSSFFAYDPAFRGGVRVAVGDVNGDGTPDIVTGAGIGGGPHVRAYSGTGGAVLLDFFAYDAAFRGGVFVAADDIDGDGRADIVTGAGAGGGPHVKVFSGNGAGLVVSFFAYDVDFRGGVRVAAGDMDGDGTPDIVTGPGDGGGPHVKVFSGADGSVIDSFLSYDPALRFGIYVAAGER